MILYWDLMLNFCNSCNSYIMIIPSYSFILNASNNGGTDKDGKGDVKIQRHLHKHQPKVRVFVNNTNFKCSLYLLSVRVGKRMGECMICMYDVRVLMFFSYASLY